MNNTNRLLPVALTLALLAGCGGMPKQIPELEEARAEVARARGEPLVQQAASISLKEAEAALRSAEEAYQRKRDLDLIRQESYRATRQAQIAQAQVRELQARQQIETSEAERNRVLLEAREREAQSARAQAQAAQAQVQGLRQANEAAEAQARSLREQMLALQAKQTERGMVLTLTDVLFDTGQATLRAGALNTMERIAAFLRSNSAVQLLVEGHTDSQGSDAYNQDLSIRRADAVRQALSTRGVDPGRVQVRGLGEGYPVASNDSPAGRQQNRRVEIVFSDEAGGFAPGAERAAATGRQ